ncbi:MAG: ComEC/Rec2 family competence protein, partial [Candidatus Cryptobacteroides sp.]
MVQVKNIEILGTSFLAGSIAGCLFLPHPSPMLHSALCAVFFIVAATVLFLRRARWIPLLILTCLCGMLCILRGAECGMTAGETLGQTETSLYFCRAIDGLGFRNAEVTALVKALLLGDRSGLSVGTVQDFRQSGASHILALSGLHLGIV